MTFENVYSPLLNEEGPPSPCCEVVTVRRYLDYICPTCRCVYVLRDDDGITQRKKGRR